MTGNLHAEATAAAASVGLPSSGNGFSIDAWLSRPRNWIACIFAVLALQCVLVITHKPWLDEWQALQISLQSPTLSALFENLHYEGHPPLWYLMLRAAGRVLPPAWVLPFVQLPVALAIQGLILFRLPFSRLERLLIACNAYVLVDYGAISRSLGLGVLFFVAAILFRHRRVGWLAVAALPMVDFLFGVLSVLTLPIYWRERRLWAPGAALWFASGIASAWTVRPAPDMIPALWLTGPVQDGLVEVGRFGAVLLPFAMVDRQIVWNALPTAGPAFLGGILFIAMGLWLLRSDRLSQALFASFVALILVFSVSVYPLAIRHVSLAAVLLIMLVAVQRDDDERRPFDVWLAVGAVCGIALSVANLGRPFDSADPAAAFILDHHLETKHWVSFPDSRAQGVSALTGIEFERAERNCTESFIRWNYRTTIETAAALERELQRISDRSGSFYLLTDFDLFGTPIRHPAAYRQLAHFPAGLDGYNFYLYQVRPDLPEKPERLPRCAPKRLPLRIMD
jgi:hypothetical protein